MQRWFAVTLGEPTIAQQNGWAIREGRHTLIAAPTGSGKTLAAFLTALDDLFQESLEHPLPDEVRVVYVSPLKALSADIHKGEYVRPLVDLDTGNAMTVAAALAGQRVPVGSGFVGRTA